MTTSHIAVTRSADLQALGTGGQLAIEAAGALAALLTRELSPAHAALFAEPHPNPARGEVDWYAEGDGDAASLSAAPPEVRTAAQAELDGQVRDIRALSERLRTAPRESDRFLGEMLALALELPDADSIRVRNGRPVLVAWGHVRANQRAGAQQLLGHALRPAAAVPIRPPPPPPAAPVRPAWPWLASLVGAGLVLLLALLLLADPFRWLAADAGMCRIAPADLAALRAYEAEQDRGAALRARLAHLYDDAGGQRLACPPGGTANAGGRGPAVADSGGGSGAAGAGDVRRAQQRGGHGGRLEIVLAWDDRSDLDLHVGCPGGEELNFQNRSACGGALDVDANSEPANTSDTPVENAAWSDPPPGRYTVVVDPYQLRGAAGAHFRVTIRQQGQPDRVVEGTARQGQRGQVVAEVEVPPS